MGLSRKDSAFLCVHRFSLHSAQLSISLLPYSGSHILWTNGKFLYIQACIDLRLPCNGCSGLLFINWAIPLGGICGLFVFMYSVLDLRYMEYPLHHFGAVFFVHTVPVRRYYLPICCVGELYGFELRQGFSSTEAKS